MIFQKVMDKLSQKIHSKHSYFEKKIIYRHLYWAKMGLYRDFRPFSFTLPTPTEQL